jgi:phosphotransferase family enzyme
MRRFCRHTSHPRYRPGPRVRMTPSCPKGGPNPNWLFGVRRSWQHGGVSDDEPVPLRGAGLQDRGVLRIGDTVRRPSGHWRESVHHLMRHVRREGLLIVPEPLGVDDEGREVLRFVPGRDQGWPFGPEVLSDAGAGELGRLATSLREALATYECPPDARWHSRAGAPGPGEAMQHGDLGPWNLLWGRPSGVTGLLDWDLAEPGDPWYDTGFLAWFTVPLMDDVRAHARGFAEPPDRKARLAAFARGAGLEPQRVLELGMAAQREFAARATRTEDPWPELRARGLGEATMADLEWTRAF